MATRCLALFTTEIGRARDIVALGQAVGSLTSGRVDASDIYRAALVQGVSALDSYVHGVVLDRAVDTLMNRIVHTGKNPKVGIHFTAVARILSAPTLVDQELAARSSVAERLSLETFQQPDDIAKALAMVGVGKLWSTAYPAGSSNITKQLSLIVSRRNRIVHQCDADALTPGQVTPLSDVDALDSIQTIESIVGAIDVCC